MGVEVARANAQPRATRAMFILLTWRRSGDANGSRTDHRCVSGLQGDGVHVLDADPLPKPVRLEEARAVRLRDGVERGVVPLLRTYHEVRREDGVRRGDG